jgi:hypothetical protein
VELFQRDSNFALVPDQKTKRWQRAILGDWSLSLWLLARSAFPVQVNGANVVVDGTEYATRLKYNGGNPYVRKAGGPQKRWMDESIPANAHVTRSDSRLMTNRRFTHLAIQAAPLQVTCCFWTDHGYSEVTDRVAAKLPSPPGHHLCLHISHTIHHNLSTFCAEKSAPQARVNTDINGKQSQQNVRSATKHHN